MEESEFQMATNLARLSDVVGIMRNVILLDPDLDEKAIGAAVAIKEVRDELESRLAVLANSG